VASQERAVILSLRDLKQYQQEDLLMNGRTTWHWTDRFRFPVLAFQRKLRRTEYVLNHFQGGLWRLYRGYARRNLRVAGMKLGFTISANIFGPGLSIAHWGTIVVNPDCRVGARCRIHPGVCLGWRNGGVPALGDDCYLGPGAKVYGGVILGDRTKVGPNAVVNRSYPKGDAILVAPRECNIQKTPDIAPAPSAI
jgi:serine O-acetyltransferase